MIPLTTKKLFEKEPKTIIRTMGTLYAGMGAWCFAGMYFMSSTISSFPKDDRFVGINRAVGILQNIWLTYMPLLILIGMAMIFFSFVIERVSEQRLVIQAGILILCTIWVIAYAYANIPYVEAFQSISPQHDIFTGITYILAIIAFGGIFVIMILPNYRIFKKLKAKKTGI